MLIGTANWVACNKHILRLPIFKHLGGEQTSGYQFSNIWEGKRHQVTNFQTFERKTDIRVPISKHLGGEQTSGYQFSNIWEGKRHQVINFQTFERKTDIRVPISKHLGGKQSSGYQFSNIWEGKDFRLPIYKYFEGEQTHEAIARGWYALTTERKSSIAEAATFKEMLTYIR